MSNISWIIPLTVRYKFSYKFANFDLPENVFEMANLLSECNNGINIPLSRFNTTQATMIFRLCRSMKFAQRIANI